MVKAITLIKSIKKLNLNIHLNAKFWHIQILFKLLSALICVIEVKCYIIQPLDTTDQLYCSVQIVPPARYRLIIWDLLYDSGQATSSARRTGGSADGQRHAMCHSDQIFCHFSTEPHTLLFYTDVIYQSRLNELAKCFVYFHSIETDEQGRFSLLETRINNLFEYYHLYILPLNESMNPIPDHHFAPFAAQKIIQRFSAGRNALSNCAENEWQIKYFETFKVWEGNVNEVLNLWFLNEFYSELSEKDNFFLIANFKHALNEAIKNIRRQKASEEAKILGIFWNYLAEVANVNLLWKRLRLADERIFPLIEQFCQIDKRILLEQNAIVTSLGSLNYAMAFCQHWFVARNKANNAMQINVVMEAFGRWIYKPLSALDFAAEEIVRFWIELLGARIATDVRLLCRWPQFDQQLFSQIGTLFVEANQVNALQAETFNRIVGIKDLLDAICVNVNISMATCCAHSAIHNTLEQWKTSVCSNGTFRTQPANHRQSNEAILLQNRQLTSPYRRQCCNNSDNNNSSKCVICFAHDRQIVIDPCGHFCLCTQCAQTIENSMKPTCPICRVDVNKTIRVYHP